MQRSGEVSPSPSRAGAVQLIDEIIREQAHSPDVVGSALATAINSKDAGVREIALERLPPSSSNEERWRAFIQTAMEDRGCMVRRAAVEAVGRLNLRELAPLVFRHIHDRNKLVRVEAVGTIWMLKVRSAIPDLTRVAVEDPYWLARGYAVRAIGELGGKVAVPFLEVRLNTERSHWVRMCITLALYTLGRKALLPVLLRYLCSRNRLIRINLANNIDIITDSTNCDVVRNAVSHALEREMAVSGREALQRALATLETPCSPITAIGHGDICFERCG